MLTITILYHNTLCCSFFLNAITISTVSDFDFVCDNKRLRCLSVSYANAYTPTNYTVIITSCLRYIALLFLYGDAILNIFLQL